jgi:hypothetical protein
MKLSFFRKIALVFLLIITTTDVQAQSGLLRKTVTDLIEFFAETGTKNSSKELLAIGGEKVVSDVLEKAASQGGDDLIKQIVTLSKNSGPRALKALESDPSLMVKALKNIPKENLSDAVIEASRNPSLMSKLVRTHGDEVLAISARHPGIGTQVIEEFGEAGLKAARELSTDDVLVLAKTRGFQELSASHQKKFVSFLDRNPKEVTNFIKLVGSGTAIVLSADFINKLEDEFFGKNGKDGRLTGTMITMTRIIGGIVAAALATYAAIKLWGVWKKTVKKI